MLYMVIRYGLLVHIALQLASEYEMVYGAVVLRLLMARLSLRRKLQELLLGAPKCELADHAVHHLRQIFYLALPRIARRCLSFPMVCFPIYFQAQEGEY